MSWAAHRKTERTEDIAYCLLGIFDVGLPLIYGEGERAFRRLQEEIIKRSNDLTIFAWEQEQGQGGLCGLFAASPASFAKSEGIHPWDPHWLDPAFTMTNKGLRFDDFKLFWKAKGEKVHNKNDTTTYSIQIGLRDIGDGYYRNFRMQLRKGGPDLFIRDGNLVHDPSQEEDSRVRIPLTRFYVQTEAPDLCTFEQRSRYWSVHFQKDERISIIHAIPESHWEETSQSFFAPLEDRTLVLAAWCFINIGIQRKSVVVIIDFSNWSPVCKIFDAEEHSELVMWLFRSVRLGHDLTWNEVQSEKLNMLGFTNHILINTENIHTRISAFLKIAVVESISREEICSLHFEILELDVVI